MPRTTYADVHRWLGDALRELVKREGSVRSVASELGVYHHSLNRFLTGGGDGLNLDLVGKIMRHGGWRITRKGT